MAAESETADPQTLALSPALSLQNLYVAIGQALADASKNATNAQQEGNQLALSTMVAGVAALFSVDVRAEFEKSMAKAKAGSFGTPPQTGG